MSFKFILRIENSSYNENFPKNFLVSLKKSHSLDEFNLAEIKQIIISEYIEDDSALNGQVFYVQELVKNKRGCLDKIFKIGRIWV